MAKGQNVLFICSDQHNKCAAGCYGNPVIKTPNIDRLAQDGTKFQNAYSNNPICVPSRASMVTGQYSFNIGCYDNASPYMGQAKSFGHRLQENGLEMTTVGKLHFRRADDDTGFSDQRIPLHVRDGVGDVFGLLRDKRVTKPKVGQFPYNASVGRSSYMDYDETVTKEAIEYLNGKRDAGEPWALYVGYTLPHFPLAISQKYWDLYEGVTIPMPAAYKIGERSEHPSCQDHRRFYGMEGQYEDEVIQKALRVYYGMCSYLDDQIGAVVDKLKEIGQYENTVIIYGSDHGEMAGNHGMWNKNCMLESAVSVPLIVAGPGIPKAKTSETIVSLVDIYPTVLDALGIRLTKEEEDGLPGTSLIGLAKEDETRMRTAFSEYHSTGSLTGGFMVRWGDYKYIYYVGYKPQLFCITADPMELHDLIDDPAYAETAARLDEKLRKICDPEAVNDMIKASQEQILSEHGGRENVLATFEPVLFSPTPQITK